MTGYRCEHILGDIEHTREDYYAMLTTADGRQGRMASGDIEKIRQWIRQYEGSIAIIFIRRRTSEGGMKPLKMQGVWICKMGRCINITCCICDDHVDYDNYNRTVSIAIFDGQHQRRNTEVWL